MTSGQPARHVDVPNRLRSIKRRIPKPLKRMARAALRHYGLRTADRRVLPDFLIIGTKRGGSTSLWNWLVDHPNVAPMFPAAQQIKSPHYFDINYPRGIEWYRSHFPTRSSIERMAKRDGVRPLCGEASPYYMFHPLVSQRVHEAIPDVRILVSLRNPVDRAYSNYWERRGSNAETLATFEEAIDAEEARVEGEVEKILADPAYYSVDHDCHTYLARGRYLEHLKPWFELFGRERVHVVRFEDLKRDDKGTYAAVQEFLGLPVVDVPELPRHNRLPVPPIDAQTRARLVEYYRPHNAALAQFLGMEFDWDR